MNKLQAIEFTDGRIFLYKDSTGKGITHTFADFEEHQTYDNVKRIITFVDACEVKAKIDGLRKHQDRLRKWVADGQAEIDGLVDTLEEARARLVRYGKSTHEIDCVLAKYKHRGK